MSVFVCVLALFQGDKNRNVQEHPYQLEYIMYLLGDSEALMPCQSVSKVVQMGMTFSVSLSGCSLIRCTLFARSFSPKVFLD